MLEVVAYANKENSGVKNLVHSLRLQGYNYKIIGQGEVWKGYMNKIRAYHEYAEKKRDSGEAQTLLLLIDSFDVLAQRPPQDLLDYYYSYKKEDNPPVLIGAELLCFSKNCFRLDKYWQDKKRPSRNIHVNSGFILGRVEDLVEALKYMLELGVSDDQKATAMYMESHPDITVLDTKSLLVANINYLQYGHLLSKEDGIYYKVTGSKPCFFHTMSKNVDYIRYNYIGKKLLGEEYIAEPFQVVSADWKSKLLSSLDNYSRTLSFYLLLFLLLLLLGLLSGSLPLFILSLLLLLLVLVLLLREGRL